MSLIYFSQYNEAVFIVYLSFSIHIEKGKEEGRWGKKKQKHENWKLTVETKAN